MRPPSSRVLVYLAAALVAAGGVSAALLIWVIEDPESGTAWFEAARVTLGLGLVTGVGLLFTLTVNDREAQRERHRNDFELLTSFHRDVVTAYNGMKELRRTMAAKGWDSLSGTFTDEQVADFGAWMVQACRYQLEFERLKRLAGAQRQLFGQRSATVHDELEHAEKWINCNVVEEWERSAGVVQVGRPASLSPLPHLAAFIGPKSRFKYEVSDRMDIVEEVLGELLIAVRRL